MESLPAERHLSLGSWAAAWPLLLVALVAAVVFFYRLGSAPMNDWDEAWHAEVSREILTTGDWLTLHYRGALYFNKPPLTFWLRALSYKALGVTDTAARLPGACFAWFSVTLAAWFAARRFGMFAGATAGLILCTSWLFTTYHTGRSGETDGTLVCFHVLTFIALWRARRSPGWFYAAGAFTALAWMTKGGVAYLPWVAAGAMSIADRSDSRWRWRHAIGGLGLAILLAAPWQIAMLVKYGRPFAHAFYVHEAVEPALGVSEGHGGQWGFHLVTLRTFFQPWLSLAGAAIVAALAGRDRRPATRWIIAWAAVMFGACVLIPTKMIWYVVPALPPLAILAAMAVAGFATRRGGWVILAAAAGLGVWQFTRPSWFAPPAWAAIAFMLVGGVALVVLPEVTPRWRSLLAAVSVAVPLVLGGVTVAQVIRTSAPPEDWLLLREEDEPWRGFISQVVATLPERPVQLVGFDDSPAAAFYLRRAVGDCRVVNETNDRRTVVIARIETAGEWRGRGFQQALAMEGLAAFVRN